MVYGNIFPKPGLIYDYRKATAFFMYVIKIPSKDRMESDLIILLSFTKVMCRTCYWLSSSQCNGRRMISVTNHMNLEFTAYPYPLDAHLRTPCMSYDQRSLAGAFHNWRHFSRSFLETGDHKHTCATASVCQADVIMPLASSLVDSIHKSNGVESELSEYFAFLL